MRELVFLLEELSARAMLESLLPRLLSNKIACRFIVFEGKQDLEKQLARKIRAYQNAHARFIILRDQDSYPDCLALKNSLLNRCNESLKQEKCLVRIACRELETFYLADLFAVEQALQTKGLASQQQRKKFCDPDKLGNPKQELKRLSKNAYAEVSGSRLIGEHLAVDNTRSRSFRNLIAAIRRVETVLLKAEA